MAVYVDDMMDCVPNGKWRWTSNCHMTATSKEELHQFAAKLGMKRSWFQDKPRLPHYDLTKSRRAQAIRLGALPVDRRELVVLMCWWSAAHKADPHAQTIAHCPEPDSWPSFLKAELSD